MVIGSSKMSQCNAQNSYSMSHIRLFSVVSNQEKTTHVSFAMRERLAGMRDSCRHRILQINLVSVQGPWKDS
jgi:hypothetical protein